MRAALLSCGLPPAPDPLVFCAYVRMMGEKWKEKSHTIKPPKVFIAPIVPGRITPVPREDVSSFMNLVLRLGFKDSSVLSSSSLLDSSLSTSTALTSVLTFPARTVRS